MEKDFYGAASTIWGHLNQLFSVNRTLQIILRDVYRWKRFWPEGWKFSAQNEYSHLNFRPQTVAEHSLAMPVLGTMMGTMLDPFLPDGYRFDYQLFSLALSLHDWGEGITRNDHPFTEKKLIHELEEYNAFYHSFKNLPPEIFDLCQKAFVLQFVYPLNGRAISEKPPLKSWGTFPEPVRKIIAQLADEKSSEALRFSAVERLEYIMYAIEQYILRQNFGMAKEVISNQLPDMRQACSLVPGFKEKIWTNEVDKAAQFIRDYQ